MFFRLAVSFVALIVSGQAMAATYLIDSARSEVRAYVPNWERQLSYTNWWTPGLVDMDTGLPIPEVVLYDWTLTWPLTPFPVQGLFQMDEQPSPWVADKSHLILTNVNVTSDVPAYANFSLDMATLLSYTPSSQQVGWSSHVCYDDNYYGGNWSCSGMTSGIVWEVEGSFDGHTLDISGYFWGEMGPYDGNTFVGLVDTTQPDYLVNLDEAAGLYTYHIVAVQSVPEPESLLLMSVGFLLIAARLRFAKRLAITA